jgi:hypothetical protein
MPGPRRPRCTRLRLQQGRRRLPPTCGGSAGGLLARRRRGRASRCGSPTVDGGDDGPPAFLDGCERVLRRHAALLSCARRLLCSGSRRGSKPSRPSMHAAGTQRRPAPPPTCILRMPRRSSSRCCPGHSPGAVAALAPNRPARKPTSMPAQKFLPWPAMTTCGGGGGGGGALGGCGGGRECGDWPRRQGSCRAPP